MNGSLCLVLLSCFVFAAGRLYYFKGDWDPSHHKYGHFSEGERQLMLDAVKRMFHLGYDSYMQYAYPLDELNPINCSGRGPDYANPSNININDVLGDYILTLIESLDTLAVMGNHSEFKKAVQLVIENVSFDKPSNVQVFEANIRVLGSLLSAHLIIEDPTEPFGDLRPPGYTGQLLQLAHDLGTRLLPAFENTATGIPYPRVDLQQGVLHDCLNETCTAGAGTLVLEFGLLSRLLGDPIFEAVARRSVRMLWKYRSNVTGLLGNVINLQTGEWVGMMSGLGAGLDSFYEYLLKAYILFGHEEDLQMFNESYETIRFHMRRGRSKCNDGEGNPPIYVNVNMKTGDTVNTWIDALQAAWPAIQVLNGDVDEAICSHALYYAIWRKFSSLPERYNWQLKAPDVAFYPLRPELIESTYFLYQATKNPFYLHVGREIVEDLNEHTKAECGYGTVHDVRTKELEDRMESFFLAETCKYLYLLFDKDNHLNREALRYVFNTEGHFFPVNRQSRRQPWESWTSRKKEGPIVDASRANSSSICDSIPAESRYFLPMKSQYLSQMEMAVGLYDSR